MSHREPDIEKEVLAALLLAWKEQPYQRLGQFLVNTIMPTGHCPEIFYLEDSKLIELLKKARP